MIAAGSGSLIAGFYGCMQIVPLPLRLTACSKGRRSGGLAGLRIPCCSWYEEFVRRPGGL
jgi:hypothetical protein